MDSNKTTSGPRMGSMMKGLMPNEARTPTGTPLPKANMDFTRSGGAKGQKAPGPRTA